MPLSRIRSDVPLHRRASWPVIALWLVPSRATAEVSTDVPRERVTANAAVAAKATAPAIRQATRAADLIVPPCYDEPVISHLYPFTSDLTRVRALSFRPNPSRDSPCRPYDQADDTVSAASRQRRRRDQRTRRRPGLLGRRPVRGRGRRRRLPRLPPPAPPWPRPRLRDRPRVRARRRPLRAAGAAQQGGTGHRVPRTSRANPPPERSMAPLPQLRHDRH